MRAALTLLVCLAAGACAPRDPKRSPESAVAAFVEATERLDQPEARARAFALLDAESREILEARARTAESLSHRPFEGADMLVPSRAVFAFVPEDVDEDDVSIEGDRAVVRVRGGKPRREARVRLVREADGWHVDLGLEPDAPEEAGPIVIDD